MADPFIITHLENLLTGNGTLLRLRAGGAS